MKDFGFLLEFVKIRTAGKDVLMNIEIPPAVVARVLEEVVKPGRGGDATSFVPDERWTRQQ